MNIQAGTIYLCFVGWKKHVWDSAKIVTAVEPETLAYAYGLPLNASIPAVTGIQGAGLQEHRLRLALGLE